MPITPPDPSTAIVMAGIPATNRSLYHAIRFNVGDPAALVVTNPAVPLQRDWEPPQESAPHRLLILRDIEMDRARKKANADDVACPKDFAPDKGLSGDRETATAQATAQAVLRAGCNRVIADRTLPLSFADELLRLNIIVEYDPDLGVIDRRTKTEEEIAYLRQAQHATERAIEMACTMVAKATPNKDGKLHIEGDELTAEAVRLAIDVFLLTHGYTNPQSIIAAGKNGADCHNLGTGPIYTSQPVIIDIFPQNRLTKYNGDCTRTVVHGDIPDEIKNMHAVVLEAKEAAQAVVRPGATGELVHKATADVIHRAGYKMGFPTKENPTTMPHGTGHGIGLEVHEPPLLDIKGPELVIGDALTIEPGLYNQTLGGVRIEDMVIVTDEACENLNHLQQSLVWN
ncbi:MAG: M24 family metallopeptidase [Phycisphaeraceae bacterium]